MCVIYFFVEYACGACSSCRTMMLRNFLWLGGGEQCKLWISSLSSGCAIIYELLICPNIVGY